VAETDDTEKTEDPTAKKLEKAIESGDVAKSQEVNTWFMLVGATLTLFVFGGNTAGKIAGIFKDFLGGIYHMGGAGFSYPRLAGHLMLEVLIAVSPLVGILVLAAFAGNYIQHGPLWTTQALMPKFSRISPASGSKRIFSKEALVQLAKCLAKFALIGGVMFTVVYPQMDRIKLLPGVDIAQALPLLLELTLRLMLGVCAAMTLVAGLDWAWTRYSWYERQRMSLHEIREEHKQSEGDPTIKAKLRQIRRMRLRKSMLKSVPKATVIVTNPTHYAVALRYEPGMNAPVCVAKGMDVLALKIREIATEHRIPIVENPPLARALHKAIDIDQEVPAEHYKAVAEVIGYVMRLRRAVRH
jgi:flagellar biosynthetic protein FlhB